MTPSAIKSEAAKAGLTNVDLPTCNVADEAITTGDEAKCFATYMRIHTLEATGGYTYSQMGRYQALDDRAEERARRRRRHGQPDLRGDRPEDRRSPSRTAPATSGSRRPR